MKEFPIRIHVDNKDKFSKVFYARYLAYLRRDLFEHIIKENENTYFDLDTWSKNNLGNKKKLIETMTAQIMKELKNKGWNCKTSFGGTGLFIYSSENPPPSCYEDGL